MRLRKNLSMREAIDLIIGAIAYGAIIYFLGSYVFPRCGILFDVQSVELLHVPAYVLFFLWLAAYLTMGQIPWFASRERLRIAVSIFTSLVAALLILLFMCKGK